MYVDNNLRYIILNCNIDQFCQTGFCSGECWGRRAELPCKTVSSAGGQSVRHQILHQGRDSLRVIWDPQGAGQNQSRASGCWADDNEDSERKQVLYWNILHCQECPHRFILDRTSWDLEHYALTSTIPTGEVVTGSYSYPSSQGEEVLVRVSGLASVNFYIASYQYITDLGNTPPSQPSDPVLTPGQSQAPVISKWCWQ